VRLDEAVQTVKLRVCTVIFNFEKYCITDNRLKRKYLNRILCDKSVSRTEEALRGHVCLTCPGVTELFS
jgi:hypothetical protein